jgi:ubiquinone biosynthesis protein
VVSPLRPPAFISRSRNLKRIRQISEVAIRHGFGFLFERYNLWHVLHLKRVSVPPAPAHVGRHLREMFEELGPTFVKFGQLLSTRADLLPPEIIAELVHLQDDVPPFPYALARAVVEEDLGLTLERLFESFEREPIAAASIGQVHRAVLPGGRRVVVKVQRPDAARVVESDIELLRQLAGTLRDHLGDRLFVDPVDLVEEFAQAISQELDYGLEARNAERFARNFAGSRHVVIPRVFDPYCSRRVLTLEYVEGRTLNSLDLESLSLSERRSLAETIADAWFKQILEDGFFHGDPHPANILYVGPDRIGLLDFGTSGSLSDEDLEEGVSLFLDILDQDIPGVKRRLRALGVKWSHEKDEETTAALEQVFSRYYGTTFVDLNPGVVIEQVLRIIYNLHLELPTRYLVLEKSLLTVQAVVSQIYSDFNVFEAARPYARRLLRDRFLPQKIAGKATRSVSKYQRVIAEYPFQLGDILEELRDGQIEVGIKVIGLNELIHKLDILTNKIVVAVVTTALLLASALLAAFIREGPRFVGVSLFGAPGFVIATTFGLWLLWAIFRSGRL